MTTEAIQVLLSGSRPEYPTSNMVSSYASSLQAGGHSIYLGGNGYYWVTRHDRSRSNRIEVQPADQGCRTFGLAPANWHHSPTGGLEGLWGTRGRPPNQLFGIGSCAMGVADAAGYGTTEEARSDLSWHFSFTVLAWKVQKEVETLDSYRQLHQEIRLNTTSVHPATS
ncbi:hypothetical protein BDR22DRAFT_695536 [Usnea florida]